ncbi:MAG: SUMF1/EgtB/PvdO family nonheme iron enzyme [Bacteroidota bacterium]
MPRYRLLSALICCLIASNCSEFPAPSDKKVRAILPELTLVKDQLISIEEESNRNYLVYLHWLERVYGDSYPEILEAALPLAAALEKVLDPSYADQPVTGLSYRQVLEYAAWKTDRLNEYLLIAGGWINNSLEQKDGDSFNSEAYLCWQYQGDVRKEITTAEGEERPFRISDRFFHLGYRLPTQAELATAEAFEILPQGASTRAGDYYPYGKKHWLENTYVPATELELPAYHNPRSEYSTALRQEPFYDPLLTDREPPLRSYRLRPGQLVRLSSGVHEWTLDAYSETEQPQSYIESMLNSGFQAMEDFPADPYDFEQEKNYLGQMPFRFFPQGEDRAFIAISRQPSASRRDRAVWAGNKEEDMVYGLNQDDARMEVGFRLVLEGR